MQQGDDPVLSSQQTLLIVFNRIKLEAPLLGGEPCSLQWL